jgi:predicted nucleic acid-binding protein
MPSDSTNDQQGDSHLPENKAGSIPTTNAEKQQGGTPLLFIDTNILLDFYRGRNDAAVSLLEKIDGLHDQTIVTCQVEMEFKKNRQKVITQAITDLKLPDFNFPVPAFLSDAASVKVVKGMNAGAKKRVENLKKRILLTLEKPKSHDPIYQTVQRLFIFPGNLNLKQDSPEYSRVWRRALRRFLEGRPPRKKDDTSAGDALNWEWIVRCVEQTKRDVIVVSRDADYGVTHGDNSHANDWLVEEIKRRGGARRKIILVDRLAAALKLLAVPVTPAELSVERSLIKRRRNVKKGEVEEVIGEAIDDLSNEDEISSLIAESNADGWTCDDFTIENVDSYKGAWIVDVSFKFSGDQKDDRPWCGTEISGRCVATISADKEVTFSDISAELDRGEDESEEEEPPDSSSSG